MNKAKNPKNPWRQHILNFTDSGLSGAEYCRQNNLVYSQFLYWRSKYSPDASAAKKPAKNSADDFVPVGLSEPVGKPEVNKTCEILCSVEFSRGHRLVIHSSECLKFLPKILGLTCATQSTTGN